ncbi:vitamin K epoxide reductase [Candidatus Mycosynbacter amalyticus]|uniref:Vitamin K epoxide reductase n=2 Tax=Candidatus Mycosynbacter amalyticus TaxID=2665156 RepID=A0A857ML92_9BACT|nr:vitamin K epoxide reductase [Candidatus Mycosynbacter amalyticus]
MNKLHAIRDFFTHEDKKLRDDRWIFASMLVGAVLSLLASFVLSYDAIQIAKNPNAELSCSVNVVINCATVAKHPTAEMFGFPNSFLGLMAESVVITVAIAGLAGIRFPRGFMFAAQIGYTLGLIFAYVLFYISFFIIQALCPWCLLVTLTTTLVFFAMTRYNIRENNLYLPKSIMRPLHRWIEKDYDKLLMWSLIVIFIAAIIVKYGDGLFA